MTTRDTIDVLKRAKRTLYKKPNLLRLSRGIGTVACHIYYEGYATVLNNTKFAPSFQVALVAPTMDDLRAAWGRLSTDLVFDEAKVLQVAMFDRSRVLPATRAIAAETKKLPTAARRATRGRGGRR